MDSQENTVTDSVEIQKKSNIKVIVGLAVVVLVLLSAAAFMLLGSSSAKGTWELYSIEQGTSVIEGEDLEVQYGGKVLYNLNDNGVLVVEMLGQDIEGTWSEDGDTVIFHYSSSVKELHRDGKTMTLEQNGATYTFVK